LLREDYAVHQPRAAVSPGFHALVAYRFGRWQRLTSLPRPARWLLHPAYLVLAYAVQTMHAIEIYPAAKLGRRLKIAHRGAVVNGAAEVGDDCVLRQHTTIGAVFEGGDCPRLGNGVELGPGAVVIGGISVGDGAKIGPNAVVTFDVPPAGRVTASPARIVSLGALTTEEPAAFAEAQPRPERPSEARVAEFVAEVAALDAPPAADEPLISSGLVDSLNVARLLEALEEAFGVQIAAEDVGAEEFDTVAQIAAYLGERA
jgi:serine O-acetyltransferase